MNTSTQTQQQPQKPQGFWPNSKFNVEEMARFMRLEDIYFGINDGMSMPPECLGYEEWLRDPRVVTCALEYNGHIVGFYQVQGKTTVLGEITVGFMKEVPGVVKANFVRSCIYETWRQTPWQTMLALISSDNRGAQIGAGLLGFARAGRLKNAIARIGNRWRPAGLYDLIAYTIQRPERKL